MNDASLLNEFFLLTLAHMVAVASPGADFAVVLKNTLRAGKTAGVATAVGVGCGISLHVVYTLFGVALILTQSPSLFTAVKMVGGAYLLWIAWQAFQARPKPAGQPDSVDRLVMSHPQAFRQGFLTNVFNPKVTLFFLVLFTTIVSQSTPLWTQGLYGLWIVVYTMLWFIFVAWTFSRRLVLNWYQSHGHYFDWSMGLFLTFIALKLFIE